MFQLAPFWLSERLPCACFNVASYIVYNAFALPAKAVFTSPRCKHAPDSKILPVCRCFSYTKCVRYTVFTANKLYNNVRILNTFICKWLKFKSRIFCCPVFNNLYSFQFCIYIILLINSLRS